MCDTVEFQALPCQYEPAETDIVKFTNGIAFRISFVASEPDFQIAEDMPSNIIYLSIMLSIGCFD